MKVETLVTAAVAAVAIAIGAGVIYTGGAIIYERISYGSTATAASADVVSAERLWLRELISPFKGRQRWEVAYEFTTTSGAVVRSTGAYTQDSATTKPEPGRKLRARYLTEDPASSYLEDSHKLFDAAWYIGLGLFIWCVAGGLAWWEMRRPRRNP
jgi:hypothetical protein